MDLSYSSLLFSSSFIQEKGGNQMRRFVDKLGTIFPSTIDMEADTPYGSCNESTWCTLGGKWWLETIWDACPFPCLRINGARPGRTPRPYHVCLDS